jgi:hypothetical protein
MAEQRIDERLAALLELEGKLEAGLQARKAAAQLRLSRAEAAFAAASSAAPPGLEEAAEAEARRDEAEHARALAQLAAEERALVDRYRGVSDPELERLARELLPQLLGRGAP